MHDEVGVGDQPFDQRGVGDVAFDELDGVGDRLESRGIGRVGQLVQHPDSGVGAILDGAQHEVRADESGAPVTSTRM